MDATERTREIRLRRAAKRQDLTLRKSRTRDPRAIGHGLFHLADANAAVVAGGGLSGHLMSLDVIEVYLANAQDFDVYFEDPLGAYRLDDARPFLEWRVDYLVGLGFESGWLVSERSDTPREKLMGWSRNNLAQAAYASRLWLASWATDDREVATS